MARGKRLELVITGDAKGALGSLAAVDTAAGRAGGSSGGMARFSRGAGVAMAGVGTAVAAAAVTAGAALYNIGSQFDSVYDGIRVGTGATGEALEGLKDSFRAVARDVPASLDDVGLAIGDLNTRLGLTGSDLEGLATQFLNLSRLTDTDLQSNIGSITRVFGDWSIATEDQAEALDKIFRTYQATGVGIEQLTTQVVQFGAPMRELGFEFEEALAIFGAFEQAGVNIETVMAGLRQSLANMAKEGEAPAETFGRIMEEVQSGAAGFDEVRQLFGSRAATDIFRAIQEGRFDIAALVDVIANGTDTIDQAALDTYDATEKWMQFRNRIILALEPLATKVFDGVAAAMDRVAPVFEDLMARVGPVIEDLSAKFDGLGGPLAILVGAAGFGALVAVIGTVMAVLSGTAVVIGLVAAGIAALVAGVIYAYNEWEGFRNAVDAVGRFLLDVAWPAIQDFAGYVSEQFANLSGWVAEHWDEISEAVGHVVNVIRATVATGITAVLRVWQYVGDDIMGLVSAAWDFISRTIENAVAFIGGVIELGLALINGDWGEAWEALKGIFSTAWDQLLNVVRFAWEQVKGIFAGAISQVQMIWTGGWNLLKAILAGAWQQIVGVLDMSFGWIFDLIGGFASTVWGIWSGLWNGVIDFTGRALGFVVGIARGQIEHIKRAFQLGVDAIGRVWGGLKGIFSSVANWVIGNVINRFIRAVNRVADAINLNLNLPELGGVGGGGGSYGDTSGIISQGPRFHSGGVVQGVGEVPATLLGGEGVLPVEAMRRMGPRQFELLRQGKTDAIGDGFGLGAIGDVLSGVGSFVAERVRDVAANVAKPMVAAALGMLDRVTPGVPGDLFAGIARKAAYGVLSWIDGAEKEAEKYAVPALGPGVGWEAMWDVVRKQFPWAQLHSGMRPGAITATGNRSYHSMGRAIDITPSMDIFDWLRSSYKALTKELIFSPAGGRQVHNGSDHMYSGVTRANHWDHIHWAMGEGGDFVVRRPTHFTAGDNGPERATFTPLRGGQPLTTSGNLHVHMEGAVIIGDNADEAVLKAIERRLADGGSLGPATRRALGLV